MPKGKAIPIVLSPVTRRILEGEREFLEASLDEYQAENAEFEARTGKKLHATEVRIFALLRLKAILLAANGWSNKKISEETQISQHTIGKWRREFSYILSREDLPRERLTEFFWYSENPVVGVLAEFENKK